ncbi:MAG: EAL domain-containing protein, partial [Peptostreptococcaceae bacterium]
KIGDKDNSRKYALELSEVTDYEKQSIHKDYMNYIVKKDEMRKVEDEIKVVESLNILLITAIVVGSIFAYKINIYPILKIKKLRKKVELNISNNKYLTYYQPIINPKKNEIVGFEALLRLKENDKLIMPNIIIKEIEESNMMSKVSIWILTKIIEDYKVIESTKNIGNNFYISMNISLKEVEDDNVIGEIINIVKSSELKRNAICIEITENIGATNMNKVANNIVSLRNAGILIAIDDFGVEYSNLSIIDSIEYDIVKIDKTFINNIDKSELNKSVILFCDYLLGQKGKVVVIEGVEENNQVEFIKNTKSEKFYIQGYFYSKPVGIDEVIKFEISK